MKEATGELNMTLVTIIAISVIAGILALMWEPIKTSIQNSWGGTGANACENSGGTWDASTGTCH